MKIRQGLNLWRELYAPIIYPIELHHTPLCNSEAHSNILSICGVLPAPKREKKVKLIYGSCTIDSRKCSLVSDRQPSYSSCKALPLQSDPSPAAVKHFGWSCRIGHLRFRGKNPINTRCSVEYVVQPLLPQPRSAIFDCKSINFCYPKQERPPCVHSPGLVTLSRCRRTSLTGSGRLPASLCQHFSATFQTAFEVPGIKMAGLWWPHAFETTGGYRYPGSLRRIFFQSPAGNVHPTRS